METNVPEKRRTRQSYKTLTIRVPRVREPTGIAAGNPSAACDALRDVAHLGQEAFWTLTLNTHRQLIQRHLISLGTVDGTLIHPCEIMRPAILDAARCIIIAHNHPSNQLEPSEHDLDVTHQILHASRQFNIQLLDHLIIGRGRRNRMCWYSFAYHGDLDRLRKRPLPKRLKH